MMTRGGVRGQDGGLRDLRRQALAGRHGGAPDLHGRQARVACRYFRARARRDQTQLENPMTYLNSRISTRSDCCPRRCRASAAGRRAGDVARASHQADRAFCPRREHGYRRSHAGVQALGTARPERRRRQPGRRGRNHRYRDRGEGAARRLYAAVCIQHGGHQRCRRGQEASVRSREGSCPDRRGGIRAVHDRGAPDGQGGDAGRFHRAGAREAEEHELRHGRGGHHHPLGHGALRRRGQGGTAARPVQRRWRGAARSRGRQAAGPAADRRSGDAARAHRQSSRAWP